MTSPPPQKGEKTDRLNHNKRAGQYGDGES